jgi:hypothetical protein
MQGFPEKQLAISADCREWSHVGGDVWHEVCQVLNKS